MLSTLYPNWLFPQLEVYHKCSKFPFLPPLLETTPCSPKFLHRGKSFSSTFLLQIQRSPQIEHSALLDSDF